MTDAPAVEDRVPAPSSAAGSEADAELLARIARGQLGGFDVFVNRYKHRVLRFVRLRIADGHAAQDVSQEVFLRLFRAARAGAYTGEASVATWLFTIAGNCVTDHLRHGRRQRALLQRFSELSPDRGDPRPDEDAHRDEQALQVRQLLEQLPAPQRQVVEMRIWAGLTFREIAELCGVPLPTVKARMLYGLRKLAKHLRETGELTP